MPEHDEVLGGIASADAALILMKGEVKQPVHTVFDAPMAANGLAKGSSRKGMTEQVLAILRGPLGSTPSLSVDHANRL